MRVYVYICVCVYVCVCVCVCIVVVQSLNHVRFCETPRTVAQKALLSMGFSRQAYWNGLPFHSPGDRPDQGIKPPSPALQEDS